jgi:hypothetical protein
LYSNIRLFNIVDATIFEGLQDLLVRMDTSPSLRVVLCTEATPFQVLIGDMIEGLTYPYTHSETAQLDPLFAGPAP